MLPLISVEEARNRILSRISPLKLVRVPLAECVGKTLAEDILSPMNLPTFTNSAVDGFAVRAEDVLLASREKPVHLKVVADIPAGLLSDANLDRGQAARIMTGAPVLRGATAVVAVEDTDFNFREAQVNAPSEVNVFAPVSLARNIRFAGEDVKVGERILKQGKIIDPQEIGFLSMLGFPDVLVYSQPRVAIFSTGNELVRVGEKLAPGLIYDSNSFMLQAQVEKCGGIPVQLGIVPDVYDLVKQCLEVAVDQAVDIILSSAGVSVGAFDFVRRVVEENGELDFWRINIRPGKPLTFGSYKGIPFFGLPGNPVSAFIGFEIFVRPAIQQMLGLAASQKPVEGARLLEEIHSDGRESYLRAIVDVRQGEKYARLTGHQGSGNLKSLVEANALLIIPSGVKCVAAGERVDFIWIGDCRDYS